MKFTDVTAMHEAIVGFDAFVYQPTGDKASGNVSLMKVWGKAFEVLSEVLGVRALFFPETCQVHAHHRGKLLVKSLQHHTVRHFSLSHLTRLPALQGQLVSSVEQQVDQRLHRVLERIPTSKPGEKLRTYFDILYSLDDDAHKRKFGKTSRLHTDIEAVLALANGGQEGNRIVHYCRTSSGRLCCNSLSECKEKVTVASLNLLLSVDGIPCESRWTNLLPNFKKTLTRKVLFELGIAAFSGVQPPSASGDRIDAEDAARAEYLADLTGVRLNRTKSYLSEESTFHQLAVLTMVLMVADQLLYAMLGGVDRKGPPCKLWALVDKDGSIIGRALAGMLGLLDQWDAGDELRRPWCVLGLVGAPSRESSFALWARAQILRMAASLSRRYELKYSSWPYPLAKLCKDTWSDDAKGAVALAASNACACCLDPFSRGLLKTYNTPELLLGEKCKLTLEGAFSALRITTDWCERQNAEVQALRRVRGRAPDFTDFARANLLKQCRVAHLHRGGKDPMAPEDLKASAKGCIATVHPLLPLPEPAKATDSAPAAQASMAQGCSSHSGMPALLGATGEAGAVSGGRTSSAASSLVAAPPLDQLVTVSIEAGGAPNSSEAPDPSAKRVGLNPFLAFRNKFMQAAKQAAGRTLSAAEMEVLGRQAKEQWATLDHSAHLMLYRETRQAPKESAPPEEEPYTPMWGGGTRGSPITALEMYRFHKQVGWPSDNEISDELRYCTKPAPPETFQDTTGFNLFGCGRSGIAVCRQSLVNPLAFDVVHRGIVNFLDNLPRSEAESASIVLMVEGRLQGQSGEVCREVAVVAGTCWAPRVCDLALCHFGRAEDASDRELRAPFEICLSRRDSLCVSEGSEVLNLCQVDSCSPARNTRCCVPMPGLH